MQKIFIMSLVISLKLFASSLEECTHLLARTSFGVTQKDLSRCLKDQNYETSIENLLLFSNMKKSEETPYFAKDLIRPSRRLKDVNATERSALKKELVKQKIDIRLWWFNKMLTTNTPFEEKMVLFWHNHFASKLEKVVQPSLMYRQNQLFRKYALGNFGELLHKVVEDPAMLIFLDNRSNKKTHPNENLGRELLELFTIGEGHYTEKDIKEVSRTLTGYGIDYKYDFEFKKQIHDDGEKNIFGNKGNYDAHQMIDIVLQQDATAEFIVKKLWKSFIGERYEENEVKRLAKIFRKNNYELKPLLRALFISPSFTDPSIKGKMIKSPVDFVVGTLRSLNNTDLDRRVAYLYIRKLGEDLFDPPNVKGWPGGNSWINAHTLLLRKDFLERVVRGTAKLDQTYTLFKDTKIASTPEESAISILLPTTIFLTPATSFNTTLETILQHPLYQLK